MVKEEVRIKHHGRESFGVYYRPDRIGRYPLVIFSHGYNGTQEGAREYAEYFAQRGISCFCHDFCGGSVNSRSSMETAEMTVLTEEEDLLAVFAETGSWDSVDKKHIFMVGESQGGFVSALAAESLKEKLCGLILIYPAFCIPDDWRARYPETQQIPKEIEFWGMKLGGKYIEEARKIDTFSQIGGYSGPVQIIHGTKDATVPLEYSQKASTVYGHAGITILEGEGHGFTPAGRKKVIEVIEEMIMNTLQETAELLLEIEIKCGKAVSVKGNHMDICMIPFSGKAEGPYFTGQVSGEGVDTQKTFISGTKTLSARYVLEGKDYTGRECRIFIENEGLEGKVYHPLIVTDSKALAEWEEAYLWDTVTGTEDGVRIKIYRS